MKLQNCDQKSDRIRSDFLELKRKSPDRFRNRLALSWSNWGFGVEPLAVSVARLAKAGVGFIELHGNHYGSDLGYRAEETLQTLEEHGVKVSGICGMFSADNDFASNRAIRRQAALDYVKRELRFASEVGASYMLVVPGAVGRPQAYDSMEFERSADTLRMVAHLFVEKGVKVAIEPIRSAETSLVHTVADAKHYIQTVNHPGVQHINGDVYHMQSEESHIGTAIIDAGSMLINLHMADSNRCGLGLGALDLDTVIRALYLIGYNTEGHFVTPEPLGPGGDPYPAMYGKPDRQQLDELVGQTVRYFREREAEVLSE